MSDKFIVNILHVLEKLYGNSSLQLERSYFV